MAGFCTQCGQPLPESGICPCTAQNTPEQPSQPPQQAPVQPNYPPQQAPMQPNYPPQQAPMQPNYPPQQPYAPYPPQQAYPQPVPRPVKPKDPNGFGACLSKVPALIKDYCKDFVETSRRLDREGNMNYGFLFMLLALVLTMFGSLLFGLIHLGGTKFFGRWLIVGIFAPVLGFGLNLGLVYGMTALNKIKVRFGSALSVVGLTSLLPSALLALSSLLSLLDGEGRVFLFFALLIVVAWIITMILTVIHTYEIKLNLLTLGAAIVIAFLGIVIMRAMWAYLLSDSFQLAFYIPTGINANDILDSFYDIFR